MFRKTMIAIAAVGALGAAALAPTSASAWGGKGWGGKGWGGKGWGGFHHHRHYRGIGYGLGFVGATIAYDACLQKRWVDTPYGVRLRLVNVCY